MSEQRGDYGRTERRRLDLCRRCMTMKNIQVGVDVCDRCLTHPAEAPASPPEGAPHAR